MMKKLLLACACLLGSTPAVAGPAWEFTAAGNDYSNGVWNFATAFTANANVVVTGLGFYANGQAGLDMSAPAALYQCADAACLTTGTLLASAIVDNTYAQVGHYRYAPIAPVKLEVGQSYLIAGISNNNNYTWADVGYSDDPSITRLSNSGQYARWDELTGPSLDIPAFLTGSFFNDIGLVDGFQGPNMFFDDPEDLTFSSDARILAATPEPATWASMIAGFGGIGAVLRRRGSRNTNLAVRAT